MEGGFDCKILGVTPVERTLFIKYVNIYFDDKNNPIKLEFCTKKAYDIIGDSVQIFGIEYSALHLLLSQLIYN